VNIAPGITGLLPKSKWRDSVEASQFENKKRGDEILVQIDQILFEEKKISLAIPGEAEDVTWRAHQPTSGSGFASMGDALKGLKLK
jgi:small subunit ribosomal protein S1